MNNPQAFPHGNPTHGGELGMTDKELFKLALDALETECDIYREHDEDGAPEYILETITALKEQLADPMREVQRLGQEIEQEPVAWMLPGTDSFLTAASKTHHGVRADSYTTPLYTTPQPQRKPLTDEEAFKLVKQDNRMEEYAEAAVRLIRRTEAAHGIKENT